MFLRGGEHLRRDRVVELDEPNRGPLGYFAGGEVIDLLGQHSHRPIRVLLVGPALSSEEDGRELMGSHELEALVVGDWLDDGKPGVERSTGADCTVTTSASLHSMRSLKLTITSSPEVATRHPHPAACCMVEATAAFR